MSTVMTSALQEQLDKHNLSLDDWKEFLQLDYAVLV